ncbi:AAA family ATPase [Paenibacillus campi]|uniref:AAA family ATPase n=1 Tax=Paenibacillus campi TaxID=3106031 RepID=UPI002AFE933D|nr:AAA family ATPase [Paenibacillus sp. SGZ-1014]
MKILRFTVHGLDLFPEGFDFNFVAQQNVTEDNNEGLEHLFANMYTHNALALIGINASGKTASLKLISAVLNIFFAHDRLNIDRHQEVLKGKQITITSYFYTQNEFILKLDSSISKNEKGEWYFAEEVLYKKKIKSIKSKLKLFEFNERDFIKKRSLENHEYLVDDLSIFVAELKKEQSTPEVFAVTGFTNFNFMNIAGNVPLEVIQFLDPSIEYVKAEKMRDTDVIRLKFKSQTSEIEVYPMVALENYLSSGTIKGLNLFAYINHTLKKDGYLIVDELENHFNKAIVRTIIGFFRNEKTNPNGATLIFSTHYPELLDDFDRNDSIYVCRKQNVLSIINLMYLLKRNDMKKSEVYQSDFIGGTAPDYNAYISLKDQFIKLHHTDFVK